jgi:RNA polymerase sigma factor (sigma-70 family)
LVPGGGHLRVMGVEAREAAFRSLHDAAAGSLIAHVRRRFPYREPREIVDEVFVVAWRRIDDIPAGREVPWLCGVAANVVRNRERSERRAVGLRARLSRLEPSGAASGDPELELYEQVEALVQAMGMLPRAERDALSASWLEGLSPAEVAARLGISVNAVHVRLHRARERLSIELGLRRPARTLTFTVPPAADTEVSRRARTWFMAGSHPAEYAFERITARTGELRCRAEQPGGFGTLMQRFKADAYRARRVSFSGELRAEDVDGPGSWGGLWLRVDSLDHPPIVFDNMQERPIRGSTGWCRARVVLDVTPRAATISLGMLLVGRGRLSVRNLCFAEVGRDVPVTALANPETLPAGPGDLDFERIGAPRAGEVGTGPYESAYE